MNSQWTWLQNIDISMVIEIQLYSVQYFKWRKNEWYICGASIPRKVKTQLLYKNNRLNLGTPNICIYTVSFLVATKTERGRYIPAANWMCAFKFLGMHYASETGFLQEGMLQLPSLASSAYREKNENVEARMCFCMASRCIHRNLHFLREENVQGDS